MLSIDFLAAWLGEPLHQAAAECKKQGHSTVHFSCTDGGSARMASMPCAAEHLHVGLLMCYAVVMYPLQL